jgi:exosortase A
MTAIAQAGSGNASAWRGHGLALGTIIVLIALAFHDAVSAALQVWIVSPTYSHCFLIIPIVAWLVWEKRDALAMIRPVVAPRFLCFCPFLLILWWMGELSAINEVRQFAVIALIQVMILTFLGVEALRLIWFPILFLLFVVPTGEYLIAPMQGFATHFVDIFLTLLRIPHYTEGTTFELTNGRFEIAEACAGLRFLVATVTLGVLFCYLMFRKAYKVALFLLACVVVPLIGNGLRCVGIILIAHFSNNKYGAGADHIIYGWGFNVAILLVLILLGSFFRDDVQDKVYVSKANPKRDSVQRLAMVMGIAAALISAGPAYAWWHNSRGAAPNMSAIVDILRAGGWQEKTDTGKWSPQFPGADAQLMMSTRPNSGSQPVDLFFGYYARPRTGHTMTAHLNQAWDIEVWNRVTGDMATAPQGPNKIRFREATINSGYGKRLVWSTYWVNDQFTQSVMAVKLLQAKAVFEGRESQAFFAISTPIEGTIEDSRARLAHEVADIDLSKALDHADMPAPNFHDGAR